MHEEHQYSVGEERDAISASFDLFRWPAVSRDFENDPWRTGCAHRVYNVAKMPGTLFSPRPGVAGVKTTFKECLYSRGLRCLRTTEDQIWTCSDNISYGTVAILAIELTAYHTRNGSLHRFRYTYSFKLCFKLVHSPTFRLKPVLTQIFGWGRFENNKLGCCNSGRTRVQVLSRVQYCRTWLDWSNCASWTRTWLGLATCWTRDYA